MRFDVDKTFCISLSSRPDRQELARKNLARLADSLEFWLVDKDAENPTRGCYNSHRDIALYGLEHGLERILVFEDDAVFYRMPSAQRLAIYNAFLTRTDWDLFYIGGLLGNIWPTSKRGIVGCRLFAAHSYVISRRGMEKLASVEFTGLPIDLEFPRNFRAYASYPFLTGQTGSDVITSDIFSRSNRSADLSGDMWLRNDRSQFRSLLKNLLKFECVG